MYRGDEYVTITLSALKYALRAHTVVWVFAS